ncbi:Small subunit (SSU) processome component [Phlyctochytrium bullatum]|nr:Small subunit (SSU) processome component [Phlyctochytrium bullatum]
MPASGKTKKTARPELDADGLVPFEDIDDIDVEDAGSRTSSAKSKGQPGRNASDKDLTSKEGSRVKARKARKKRTERVTQDKNVKIVSDTPKKKGLAEAEPVNPAVKKYERGKANLPIKSIEDKKLKGTLRKIGKKYEDAAKKAARSEKLQLEEAGFLEAEGMERTYKFTQKELEENVDMATQRKMFALDLDVFGPYHLDYTRNGRHLLLAGQKGHISTFNWETKALGCEFHVRETIRSVKWLHNETMFAVAQKEFVYIYDQSGTEIHCLRKHVGVNCLEFLPYHFLLATVGKPGRLIYQDTSTGSVVAEQRTKLGECKVMRQNPYNAILHLGHHNGTVTLWSPNVSEPLVKMLCHRGPVQSLAIDRTGKYMVTAGLDGQMKVWDIRTYKAVEQYFTTSPAASLDISQMGILAVGHSSHVTLWKDALTTKAKSPYMHHLEPGSKVNMVRFCPYEDVLGFGHVKGFRSLVIPGSGEPNYDALEVNPYQTKKQRQTSEVKALLEKIQPEMISLDPNVIGTVDRAPQEVLMAEKKLEFEANNPKTKFAPRKKARGKSSAMRRYVRKQANILDPRRAEYIENLAKEKAEREKERKRERGEVVEDDKPKPYSAVDRFARKRRKVE